jgi:hypothetical protein
MHASRRRQEAALGRWSSLATAIGIVLSGPGALIVVDRVAPQPSWQDARLFIEHYHPVQTLPFALGLLLVCGCVGMVVAASRRLARTAPLRATLGLVAVTVFAAMISINYVVQTTFVPALVDEGRASDQIALAAFTMANPRSLGWSLEMWGYGMLGVATWLVAPAMVGLPLGRFGARLFVVNGVVSVAGGVLAAVRLDLVIAPLGLALFVAWNALMLVLALTSAYAWSGAGSRAGYPARAPATRTRTSTPDAGRLVATGTLVGPPRRRGGLLVTEPPRR